MTTKAAAAIEEAFDKNAFVDSSGWLDEARAVKDDVEIALLTRCAEVCVEQYELQVKALKEKSWREYELAMHGWAHVLNRCAEALGDTDVNFAIGDAPKRTADHLRPSARSRARLQRRPRPSHPTTSSRSISAACPTFSAIGWQWARIVSLRKLTSEEKDIDAITSKAYECRGVSMVRDGASCSDIDDAVRRCDGRRQARPLDRGTAMVAASASRRSRRPRSRWARPGC
jgi:hypothetical protein